MDEIWARGGNPRAYRLPEDYGGHTGPGQQTHPPEGSHSDMLPQAQQPMTTYPSVQGLGTSNASLLPAIPYPGYGETIPPGAEWQLDNGIATQGFAEGSSHVIPESWQYDHSTATPSSSFFVGETGFTNARNYNDTVSPSPVCQPSRRPTNAPAGQAARAAAKKRARKPSKLAFSVFYHNRDEFDGIETNIDITRRETLVNPKLTKLIDCMTTRLPEPVKFGHLIARHKCRLKLRSWSRKIESMETTGYVLESDSTEFDYISLGSQFMNEVHRQTSGHARTTPVDGQEGGPSTSHQAGATAVPDRQSLPLASSAAGFPPASSPTLPFSPGSYYSSISPLTYQDSAFDSYGYGDFSETNL